jgi:signal transduction histidine kinase/DNA-binding response OmpR family regulator
VKPVTDDTTVDDGLQRRLVAAAHDTLLSVWEYEMRGPHVREAVLRSMLHGDGFYVASATEPAATFSTTTDRIGVHPDDVDALVGLIQASAAGARSDFQIEVRAPRRDAGHRWRLVRGTVLRSLDGTLKAFGGSSVDITAQKQAEEESNRDRARLELALRGSNMSVFSFELAEGGLGNVTPTLTNFWEPLGYDPASMPTDFQEAIKIPLDADDQAKLLQTMHLYLSGAIPHFEVELRLRKRDGSDCWKLARGMASRREDGAPVRFVGSCVDITGNKLIAQDLERARQFAEHANKAKDDFLANVSHEIRTPMNAILGMTELVLESPMNDSQRQLLRTVKSAADSLLGMLNDLLDFSKIVAGKLELDPTDFSLRAVLAETLRALAPRVHRKGLELVSVVREDVPDALIGDVGRLRQVITNLVGNATKFTERGEVVAEVSLADDPAHADETTLHFSIRDTGIGISPEKQERIFRAFEQEDSSTTRKYGGTGLGLSIASRLVALMGGRIAVKSTPGVGSTFSFDARFSRQRHPVEQVPPSPPVVLRGLRVLVVDDNPTNLHILQEWLRGWHMRPTATADALSALGALWDAATLGDAYSLVLLDSRMPDSDGWALAAKIRERTALAAVPIIMLTSGDRPGDPARSRDLRIDAHLLKPLQQSELLDAIYQVMSTVDGSHSARSPGQRARAAPVAGPAKRALKILVAEDSEFSAQFMTQLLTQHHHLVVLATNGREAQTLAAQTEFDLLLLDLHMPELDGVEVAKAIRQREQTTGGHLPIVALTARSRKEDRERCLAAGMDDFLTKPVGAGELLEAIHRLVSAGP